MDFSKIPQKLVAKIQALLKLQESAQAMGSIEEAANAAARISDMLLKYNLDMQDITSVDYEAPAVISEHIFETMDFEKSHEGGWVIKLVRVIARANMCRAFTSDAAKTKVWVIGTQTNADMVWFITEQLVNRLRPIKATEWAKYTGYEKRNTWARGFFSGAVTGIGEQLMRKEMEERRKAQEQERAGVAPGQGLLVMRMVDKEVERINDFVSKRYAIGRGSSKPGTKSVGGKQTGYATGKSMSIHGGVTSGQRRLG